MTKLSRRLAALTFALASAGAMAATTTDDFVVSVTFTSSCTVTTAAADLAFTYTAFDSAVTKNTSTTFSCTRGLTPTFAFDNAAGQTGSAPGSATATITGEGLIAGLRYTLSGTTTKTAGTAASAGTAGTGGSNGTADTYAVAIAATIQGNQAGDGAASTATSQTRVLTITY